VYNDANLTLLGILSTATNYQKGQKAKNKVDVILTMEQQRKG